MIRIFYIFSLLSTLSCTSCSPFLKLYFYRPIFPRKERYAFIALYLAFTILHWLLNCSLRPWQVLAFCVVEKTPGANLICFPLGVTFFSIKS